MPPNVRSRTVIDVVAEPSQTLLEVASLAEHITQLTLRWSDSVSGPLAMPAVLCKLLMDAGWLPHVTRQGELTLIDAQRLVPDAPHSTGTARFSVVIDSSDEACLQRNADASPGLREVGARVIACTGAEGPAEALAGALPHCEAEWVMVCRDDIYFPAGFGHRLNEALATIPDNERRHALIGLAGIAVDQAGQRYVRAGCVVEGARLSDHPASKTVVSLDDLAVVIARDSIHRINPSQGRTLWATELSLAAICTHRLFPQVLRLPVYLDRDRPASSTAALQEAAARLRSRYPAFGPIPTRYGTFGDSAVGAVPAEPAATKPVMGLVLADIDKQVEALTARQDYEAALMQIANGVHNTFLKPGVAHYALYYPQFDRQIERMADVLHERMGPIEAGASGTDLIIATELYQIGGHSKVVEDLARGATSPVVVLTDLFGTYEREPQQFDWIRERLGHATLIKLPAGALWEKCGTLAALTRSLRPRSISYLSHHQDPIPYVATLRYEEARRIFFHHCDHNPSLGASLGGVRHVDLSGALQTTCSAHLQRQVDLLPMHVQDRGKKRFSRVKGRAFSVVTSGRAGKFTRHGEMALHRWVRAALQAVDGQFFHIGPLPEGWVQEIRDHLAEQGIDPTRFVYLGLVTSLWSTLLQIDAAFYLGSAPVAGGRAAIEAQGAGYPVLFFTGFTSGPLVENYSLFADRSLGWHDPDSLAQLLTKVAPRHAQLSKDARRYYVEHFSHKHYQRCVAELVEA
jgi:hypothetical protein